MSVTVVIKDNFPAYQVKSIAKAKAATLQMASDILRLGKLRAPYDPGSKASGQHLVATGKIKQLGSDTVAVSFSDTLPYGRWWEYNDTHPRYGTPVHFQGGRQSHYLSSSVDDVVPRADFYFARALE